MTYAQKTPLARSLNLLAERRAADAIQLLGKALPCSVVSVNGWIVTVKFELSTDYNLPQVTIPVASSNYDYIPLQIGDPGLVVPADAGIWGVSGLADGTAGLSLVGNLSSLLFVSVGNKNNTTPESSGVRIIRGPDGVAVETMDSAVRILVNASGITMTGTLNITGDLNVSGNTMLGGATGSKKVVLDGDPVTAGVVHASSTKTKAV